QFPVVLTSLGMRQAQQLHCRLARWRPAFWPLVLAYLVDLVCTGWFTPPYAGVLGWPLTGLWTWPVFTTPTGIVGLPRTRKTMGEGRGSLVWLRAGEKRGFPDRCRRYGRPGRHLPRARALGPVLHGPSPRVLSPAQDRHRHRRGLRGIKPDRQADCQKRAGTA